MMCNYVMTFEEFVNENYQINEAKLTAEIKKNPNLLKKFIISNYAWELPADGKDYTYKELAKIMSGSSGAQHKFIKNYLKSNPNVTIKSTDGVRNDDLVKKWKISVGDIIQIGEIVSTTDKDYMYAENQLAFVAKVRDDSLADYEVLPINVPERWGATGGFNQDIEYQDKYYWNDPDKIGYDGKIPKLSNTMGKIALSAVDVINVVKRNASFYNFLMQIRDRAPETQTWIKRDDFPEIAKTKLMLK